MSLLVTVLFVGLSFYSCGDDNEKEPDEPTDITVNDLVGTWYGVDDEMGYAINEDGTGIGYEYDTERGYDLVHDAWRVTCSVRNGQIRLRDIDNNEDLICDIVSLKDNTLKVTYDDGGDTERLTLKRESAAGPGDVDDFDRSKFVGSWFQQDKGDDLLYVLNADGTGKGYELDINHAVRDYWTITWSVRRNSITITEEDGDSYSYKVTMIAPNFMVIEEDYDDDYYFTRVDSSFLNNWAK